MDWEPEDFPADLFERLTVNGISFAHYMEWALYGERGYYQSRVSLGKQGDFFTAAQFPLFGATLAHYAWDAWRSYGEPHQLQVVELGPGQGELAVHVLARLQELLPADVKISYVLIEPSLRLRQLQMEKLRSLGHWVQVSWQSPDANLDTVMFANEVLDALPVERVRRTVNGWLQAWVILDDEQLSLQWRPAPTELATAADEWLPIPVGTEAEWCWGYGELFKMAADYGQRLRSLWIDYGIDREELAAGLRPQGTLRGFSHHQVVHPLAHPGKVDITADVYWDAVVHAAMQAGFVTQNLILQGSFLRNAGLLGAALASSTNGQDSWGKGLSRSAAGQVRQLIMPGAMGERFAVLECWRN